MELSEVWYACPVGEIIYFAKNITDEDQIRAMLKNTQQYFEDW